MNEFMTSGKTEQLIRYFTNNYLLPDDEYKSLLFAMTEFSDKIRLGSVDNLDESIDKLRGALNRCKNSTVDSRRRNRSSSPA